MGGVDANTGYLRQRYRIQGRGEAKLDVVVGNSSLEASEWDNKTDFSGRKGRGAGSPEGVVRVGEAGK